jgi:UDP-glucose 4-epimerase
MKKVTIIGAGFIGKSVIRNFLSKPVEITVLDKNYPDQEFLGLVNWVTGDYHSKDLLSQVLDGAEIVLHLVSTTVPGDENVNKLLELNENISGAIDLLDLCVAYRVRKVFFASSASVYGVQDSTPINELAQTNPISSHGIQKLMIEKYFLLYKYRGDIDVQIARIANPYGYGQDIFGRQGVIAIIIGSILSDIPVELRGNGKVIRDYIFIDDLAEAIVGCCLMKLLPTIVNIGSGKGVSLNSLISIFESQLGYSISVIDTASRGIDIPKSILDIELIRSEMNFSPKVSLVSGINKMLVVNGLKKV